MKSGDFPGSFRRIAEGKVNLMQITLPLDRMTIAEKLRVIEEIMDSLGQNRDEIPSPEWHGEILKEREDSIRNGTAKFLDWEEAKRIIGDERKLP